MKALMNIMTIAFFGIIMPNSLLNSLESAPDSLREQDCPQNNNSAQKFLHNYLKDARSIDQLNKNSDINVNLHFDSVQRIEPLDNQNKINECLEFIENSPWLKNIREYSLYKADNYYFVVSYYISENNELNNKSITIANHDFEVVAFSLQFDL